MIRTRKVLPLLALLAIAIAAPLIALGAAEPAGSSSSTAADAVDLQLLVLVNRLELSDAQMATLHGILSGILDGREAYASAAETLRSQFENEMIAFDGSADELDVLLEAHRAELEALREAHSGGAEEALEQLKESLTFEQGELLLSILPRLLAGREAGPEGFVQGMERSGPCGSFGPGADRRFGGAQGPQMGGGMTGRRGFSRQGREAFSGEMPGRRGVGTAIHEGMGADLLTQLVEILELKML